MCYIEPELYTKTMTKVIVTDFSRVLLFPVDEAYDGGLNNLNNRLAEQNPDYDFKKYFKLNHELLDYYASSKVPVYIFTSETIQEHPAIKDELLGVFAGVFSAKHLGVSKTDASAYKRIAQQIDAKTSDIIYVDDNEANVAAANDAGCHGILYISNEATIKKIAEKI